MKIVFINGSYRSDRGMSGRLINLMAEGVSTGGGNFEIINLADKQIQMCTNCDACQNQAEAGKCIWQNRDDVHAIYQSIANADLVVYASPVYVMGISGLLKVFLDRVYGYAKVSDLEISKSGKFFHAIPSSIVSKPFVSLICCDNFESSIVRNSQGFFKTYAKFHSAPHLASFVRFSSKMLGSSGALPAAKRESIFMAYRAAGQQLAQSQSVKRSTIKAASQEAIPLPGFGFLKNLPPVKRVILGMAKSRQNVQRNEHDNK